MIDNSDEETRKFSMIHAVKIIHGPNDDVFDLPDDSTVMSVSRNLADAFSIPDEAIAFVNGTLVGSDYRVQPKDTVEFVKRRGEKSILDPEEKAQLDRIEAMLRQLFIAPAMLPERVSQAEQNILEAIGGDKLTGEELSKEAGYPLNSNFKNILSSMVKRGLLVNDRPGYRRPKSRLGQDC